MTVSKALKVVTIVGTRPEIIRLSRVVALLQERVEHVLVHTGQNYDYELNEIFFDELEIRPPDYYLGVPTETLGGMLGGILSEVEQVLLAEQPDAVLILGDTNSSIAAIIAKRLKIPVYHMEAGNRCFDKNVPEEINRRLIDSISDFNLVYTEHARRHLLSEGQPHRRIYLTGSPMFEVLNHYRSAIDASNVLERLELEVGKYFLVSMHREENVDNDTHLALLMEALNRLAASNGLPVIVSTHPRTRKRLEQKSDLEIDEKIQFMKPFGFFDYNQLQMSATCVLSDSGTITEESSILGFPAVTIRQAIERPEGLDTGSIILGGLDPDAIELAVQTVIADKRDGRDAPVPIDYQVSNVAQRVLKLIVGTSGLSNNWDGIVPNTYPNRR